MSVFALLDPLVVLAAAAVAQLSATMPTVVAIVVFTVLVRLVLHPLARATVRAQKRRLALAPQLRALQVRHRHDPVALRRATADLHRSAGSSPLAGALPALVQWPFFSVMYRLFTVTVVAGQANGLLSQAVFGVQLGSHLLDASGAGLLVFGSLYLLLGLVAYLGFRRARAEMVQTAPPARPAHGEPDPAALVGAAAARWIPYLSFGTLAVALVLPLAATTHLLTSAAWTLAERAWLQRRTPATT